MIIHEYKKLSKIIDEMSLYLFRKGHTSFEMKVEINKNEQTTIIFITSELEEEYIEKLNKYIGLKREREVEEYGWELLGESDLASDLEMLGLLVDKIEIVNENGKSVISLFRKYSN